jgi:predicted signal transduction protein with EAL and GGDEF domain
MHLTTRKYVSKEKIHRWYLATRGEKLRTCRAYVKAYQSLLEVAKTRVFGLEATASSTAHRELKEATNYVEILQRGLEIIRKLQQMVHDETGKSWDWKTGLREQMEIRKRKLEAYREQSNVALVISEGCFKSHRVDIIFDQGSWYRERYLVISLHKRKLQCLGRSQSVDRPSTSSSEYFQKNNAPHWIS